VIKNISKFWSKNRVYFDSQKTKIITHQEIIEAQFMVNDTYYLLILSQDCIYEQTNDILLIDLKYNVIAKEFVGLMYSTFIYDGYETIDNANILLRFNGNISLLLTIDLENKKLFLRNYL